MREPDGTRVAGNRLEIIEAYDTVNLRDTRPIGA